MRISRFIFISCLALAVLSATNTFAQEKLATDTLTVPGSANIFGAGHLVAPGPGGGGGGVLPIEIYFGEGSNRFITFDSIYGLIDCCNGAPAFPPDGGVGATSVLSYNGISGIIHAHKKLFLSGVFLTDSIPQDPAPERRDVSDIDSLQIVSTKLWQTFAIGDGRLGTGLLKQKFNIPDSATRLFLGIVDAYGFDGLPGYYSDNPGEFIVTGPKIGSYPAENNTLSFDAIDDYMEIFDSHSLDLDSILTIEAWYFYQSAFSGEPALVAKDGPASYGRYGLWIYDNEVDFCLYEAERSQQCIYSGEMIENSWHHIAAVYDGDSMYTYINGLKTGSRSFSGRVSTSDLSLFVGADPTEGLYLQGRIDELRIWNRARSLSQIKTTMIDTLAAAYYNSSDSGLVAYYRFDIFEDLGVGTSGENDIRDYSVYGNHGDVYGDAQLVLNNNVVSINDDKVYAEKSFTLQQNYPNPFNPTTTIRYDVKTFHGTSQHVNLSIYNLLGQKVATLVDKKQAAGSYQVEWNAADFASGIYIYTLETSSGFKQSRKLVLLK